MNGWVLGWTIGGGVVVAVVVLLLLAIRGAAKAAATAESIASGLQRVKASTNPLWALADTTAAVNRALHGMRRAGERLGGN